ncbi:MAG: universal stress protein [Rhodospirillales bacterium]
MYKHILIATDGSKLADKGLSHGLGLAKALKAKVTIVTATEPWSSLTMAHEAERMKPNPIQHYEETVGAAAKKILAAAETAAKKSGVDYKCVHIADTHPAEAIADTAASKRCDLIVMTSHGRRGVKRVLLGSVASEVLGNSTVPVLIVR